jgi:hypothetical protein
MGRVSLPKLLEVLTDVLAAFGDSHKIGLQDRAWYLGLLISYDALALWGLVISNMIMKTRLSDLKLDYELVHAGFDTLAFFFDFLYIFNVYINPPGRPALLSLLYLTPGCAYSKPRGL